MMTVVQYIMTQPTTMGKIMTFQN